MSFKNGVMHVNEQTGEFVVHLFQDVIGCRDKQRSSHAHGTTKINLWRSDCTRACRFSISGVRDLHLVRANLVQSHDSKSALQWRIVEVAHHASLLSR